MTETFDLQWTRTVAPTLDALTLADLKGHMRITQTQGDSTLVRYITVATDAAEKYLNRGLLTQTWKLTLHWFADVLWLPNAAPLQSVTSVQYYDSTGVLTTLAASNYDVDTTSFPGRILRGANKTWPALQSGKLGGRVVITYVVGFTDPSLIPERIKQGLRVYVAMLDSNRDGMDPNGDRAMNAAQACWDERAPQIEPTQTACGYALWPV